MQTKSAEAKKVLAKISKLATTLSPAKHSAYMREVEEIDAELLIIIALDSAILQGVAVEDTLPKFKEVSAKGWTFPSVYMVQLLMCLCEDMLKYEQWEQMAQTLLQNPLEIVQTEAQKAVSVTIESVFCRMIKNITRADAKNEGSSVTAMKVC